MPYLYHRLQQKFVEVVRGRNVEGRYGADGRGVGLKSKSPRSRRWSAMC
jgi:hypothetical protein